MKRNYLWIAATATILAGCTQNEFIRDSLSDETPEVISFDTYHSKATKAPIKEDANLIKQNGGFGIYAFKHPEIIDWDNTGKINLSSIADKYTNPIFDDMKAWYNPNYVEGNSKLYEKYEYENPRYWDKKMYYTFFVYAPWAANRVSADDETKGIFLDPATGFMNRNDIHAIQAASGAKEISITGSEVKRKQYSVIADDPETATNEASDQDVKDYLIAPCEKGQQWHNTNLVQQGQTWEKANITVNFTFYHMLSQLNVKVLAQNEKSGHKYKGIKSIWVEKLEITNLPTLDNLSSNYVECQQNKVNFSSIYNTTGAGPLTYSPNNYNNKNLEIVKKNTIAPADPEDDPTYNYTINGETTPSDVPLYVLDGGSSLEDDGTAGGSAINGYIDQKFQYYVVPNKSTVATDSKHDLNIDYYIEYLDGKKELISISKPLTGASNFDEMYASYIYNLTITITLDQIYVTVENVEWGNDFDPETHTQTEHTAHEYVVNVNED